MNSVELMARTLDAIQGVLEKPAPKPDRVLRVLVEVEVDVPVYVTLEPGDGPMVTLAPIDTWRVAPIDVRLDEWIREEIEEQLIAEDLAARVEAAAFDGYDEDDRRSRATP